MKSTDQKKYKRMNTRYLFIKIINPNGRLANKLTSLYPMQDGVFFESSQGKGFQLGYNSLFEHGCEYSSYAGINRDTGQFEFFSDYWNINAHYEYKNQDLLILSNDPFLIASLTGSGISREAVYDCMIFGRPYRSGSYFEGIRKLPACKHGQISLKTDNLKVKITPHPYWRDLLSGYRGLDISRMLRKDFKKAASNLAGEKAMLQFSGGSDSVTIFSAMKYTGMEFSCVSYKTSERTDHYIRKFCNNHGVISKLYAVDDGATYLERSLRLSAGLAPTPRFTSLFDQLEPGFIFDGYSISKGDFSDAFIHPVFGGFLQMQGRESLKLMYPQMLSAATDAIYDYWNEVYSSDFDDINTSGGLSKFQNYAMEYINQNINGAVLSPAMQMGFSPQSYFMTLQFILLYFNMGKGFASTLSIRDDYPGYRDCAIVLARINSHLNKGVYRQKLDKNLSFHEMMRWNLQDKIRYIIRKGIKRIVSKKKANKKTSIVNSETYELGFLDQYGMSHTNKERTKSLDAVLDKISHIVKKYENEIQ